jgi:integrase
MTEIRLKYVHAFVDRHGRARFYFRRRGQKPIALPGLPGGNAFMGAYHAALGAKEVKTPKGGEKSLSALIGRYYGSADFKNLSPGSQGTYRKILRNIEAKDGHRGASDLPDDKARKIIEEIGETRPALANLTRACLRALFNYAVSLKWRHTNPFLGLKAYKMGSHHTWTDEEIAAYIAYWPVGSRERTIFDLYYYTAQRTVDVAKMRRSHIGKDGRLYVKQVKTGVELWIPMHPALKRSLNAYGIKGPTLVGRIDGKQQITPGALRETLTKAVAEARLPDRCVPHGIRKAVLRQLAEKGRSSKEIAALSGHKTLKEIERYTEQADQGRMVVAAIGCLPDPTA